MEGDTEMTEYKMTESQRKQKLETAMSRLKACSASLSMYRIYDEVSAGDHVYFLDYIGLVDETLFKAIRDLEDCVDTEA